MKSMNYPFNKLNFITSDHFTNLWKFNGEKSFDWSGYSYINKAVFQRSETRMLKNAYKETDNPENSGTFGRLLVSLHTFIIFSSTIKFSPSYPIPVTWDTVILH